MMPGLAPQGPSARGFPSPAARLALVLLALAVTTGCSRRYYRRQADREVYCVVEQKASDPRWLLEDYSIQPDARSRLFDPCNPDFEPRPPDDPASHRLMHCVDGKRGACVWRKYGSIPWVDPGTWRGYLPYDEEGSVLLNRDTALALALLHSREYQTELEDLYLSALDVTQERFQFDVQFFGRTSTVFTADGRVRGGGESQSTLAVDSSGEARRLLATGGELLIGVANSLVWQFSGPDTNSAFTILDFSLIQPLLRAGGRAIALENLTQSERNLLANVRQMARFQRGFYTQIIAGRDAGVGPSAGRLVVQAAAGGVSLPTGGLFGLLEEQVRIRNQRSNVASLRESRDRLAAFFEAGLLDNSYQVDLARQRLLNAQSSLLSDTAAYEARLDAYKVTLGLPPELEVRAYDPLLERFDLITPEMTDLQEAISRILEQLRDRERPLPDDAGTRLRDIRRRSAEMLLTVGRDEERLRAALPGRRENLRRLAARYRLQTESIEQVGDIDSLNARAVAVYHDYAHLAEQITATLLDLNILLEQAAEAGTPLADLRAEITEGVASLSAQVLRLSLVQARAKLDTVTLVPIDLEADRALDIARQFRLDWMNARAALVDQWRQIQIAANQLRSDLDLTFSGDLATVGDNPVRFRGTNGRLRVGLAFDAPLTRLIERNDYRATLIAYQRARRDYLEFEDRVSQGLRNLIRSIRLGQLNFEVRRASVFVAVTRVDVARLNLEQAPKAQQAGAAAKIGTNAARDLVDALSDLLVQQNNFLGTWVDYEADRMSLDFQLGTMELDARGAWIDPGEIGPAGPAAAAPPSPDFEGPSGPSPFVPVPASPPVEAPEVPDLPPPPDLPEPPQE